MMLVTLDEAKNHLQMDHDADDAEIELLTNAAGEAVVNYLKDSAQQFLDSSGQPIVDSSGIPQVPFAVKAAVLIQMAEMYKNREALQDGEIPTQWGYGYLPRPVVALLYPLRDPAVK